MVIWMVMVVVYTMMELLLRDNGPMIKCKGSSHINFQMEMFIMEIVNSHLNMEWEYWIYKKRMKSMLGIFVWINIMDLGS